MTATLTAEQALAQYLDSKVETIRALCAERKVSYIDHQRNLASTLSVYRDGSSTTIVASPRGTTGTHVIYGPADDRDCAIFLMGLNQGILVATADFQ